MEESNVDQKLSLKNTYEPGSQMWFARGRRFSGDTQLRGFGCGLVALEDFCIYKGLCPRPESREAYLEELRKMKRRYLPIFPGLGIAPYYYPLLMDLFFLRRHLPYRVGRSFGPGAAERRLKEELQKDTPVIFAAGPTIPFLFRKKRIRLYSLHNGRLEDCGASTRAHYMTVVGLEQVLPPLPAGKAEGAQGSAGAADPSKAQGSAGAEKPSKAHDPAGAERKIPAMRVASWGRFYYISLPEFKNYMRYTYPFTCRFYPMRPRSSSAP